MTEQQAPPGTIAGFSPCGAVVEALRSCYRTACRFYAGGPVGQIEYYFVQGKRKVLRVPTVFFPRSQIEGEGLDPLGTGEIPGAKRYYSLGRDPFPGLSGKSPTGTLQEFAGEAPPPEVRQKRPACNSPPGIRVQVRIHTALTWGFGLPAIVRLKLGVRGWELVFRRTAGGVLAGGVSRLPAGLAGAGGVLAGGVSRLPAGLAGAGGVLAGGSTELPRGLAGAGGVLAGGSTELPAGLVSFGGVFASGESEMPAGNESAGGVFASGETELPAGLIAAGGVYASGETELG